MLKTKSVLQARSVFPFNPVFQLKTTIIGFFVVFGLLLCLMNVNTAQAAPKQLTLNYELSRDGQLFANVTETFSQDGKQYHIESITKGVGVYALLGDRKLTSQGEVTKAGLKPLHFESLQSKSASKALINDFDWSKQILKMQVKGKNKEEPLTAGTQDLLSVMYQSMFIPPAGERVKLPVTTGKKLRQKEYQVSKVAEPLETKAGKFSVVTLSDKDGDDEKKVFLASDQQFIPVKVILREDGNTYEQTLTSYKVE